MLAKYIENVGQSARTSLIVKRGYERHGIKGFLTNVNKVLLWSSSGIVTKHIDQISMVITNEKVKTIMNSYKFKIFLRSVLLPIAIAKEGFLFAYILNKENSAINRQLAIIATLALAYTYCGVGPTGDKIC